MKQTSWFEVLTTELPSRWLTVPFLKCHEGGMSIIYLFYMNIVFFTQHLLLLLLLFIIIVH